MTNTERVQALIALAQDAERTPAERHAALDEVHQIKKTAKVGWGKLGIEETTVGSIRLTIPKEQQPEDDGFEMSEEELAAQKGRAKPEDEADPLDEKPEEAPPPAAEAPKPARKAKEKAPKAEGDVRGEISEMVRTMLLTTDEPYSAIEAAVRAKHPHAVTTTRSIASVASDLRKAGKAVATRRVPAKAKAS